MTPSILVAVWAGARAMLKVAVVCSVGAVAFKAGIFDRSTSKAMSKMFIQLYLPLLIFSKTALAITPDNAPFLAILSVFALSYLAIGHVVGIVLYFVFRHSLPPHFQLSLIPAAAFGNNGDLVLSIVMSLTGVAPFRDGDVDRGIAYVSFWYAIFNLVFYGLSINCFKADFHLLHKYRTSQLDAHSSSSSSASTSSTHTSTRTTCWNHTRLALKSLRAHPISQIVLLPPNVGLILGLLVALIPSIKSLFLPLYSAPLSFVFDAAAFLGQAAIPLSMTVFGAALTTIELDRSILRRYPGLIWSAFALLVFRLLLLPVIGIALAYWATTSGWVPMDQPMLRFVIMVQACVPTAQICILITQFFHPRGESKEMATIMLIQYVFAMFTLTACLGYIFYIVNSIET